MVSRQVQKLSRPPPARSASPAMARWKAWAVEIGHAGQRRAGEADRARRRRGARLDGGNGARCIDADRHIAGPSLRQQGGRAGNSRSWGATLGAAAKARQALRPAAAAPLPSGGRGRHAMWDALWRDARLATMAEGGAPYGAIGNGAVAAKDGRIVFCGPEEDLPGPAGALAREVHALDGRWITPGLIDCHTHMVHGGDRAGEFEARLEGASYEALLKAGGGILSTVRATREAGEEALLEGALARLDALRAEGVTTVEVKSGYGLDVETEAAMLRTARRLGERRPVTVAATFLGAHALPPEYEGRADDYIDLVCERALPAVAAEGLADAVDAFCETVAFDLAQTERVFAAARALGLPVKLHAEQLSDMGGAALAARYGALSCDHLEFLSPEGAGAMARAGSVAVLLPGAYYFLGAERAPPVDLLRQAGAPMAVSTDCNPGSSPVTSLLTMLNMAATLFRMTPEEALAGVTREAARALGMAGERGTLAVGKACDLAVWEIERPAELCYRIGFNPLRRAVRAGVTAVER